MPIKILIQYIVDLFSDEKRRFDHLQAIGLYNNVSDEKYLKKMFHAYLGYDLDLNNPKTFNEKIQWLKLYNRNPNYTKMVDKYEVKSLVSNIIGHQYIIPTIEVWESVNKIDFENLPNSFVLKATHDSGGIIICKNKKFFNKKDAVTILTKSLNTNYYLLQREWPYKDVHRRIIAEKYMCHSDSDELTDYKFMCFGGKVKCIFTCSERYSKNGLKVTFYDLEWNILPFKRHYPARKEPEKKPVSLEIMIMLAEKLSNGIPFVRVDFYEINETPYFGEMTFFPGSGLEEFSPFEWDIKLGSWIQLPERRT